MSSELDPLRDPVVVALHDEEVRWHDPRVDPPPPNAKLFAMNPGGVVVETHWISDSFIAWHPLLPKPPWLRERLSEVYLKRSNDQENMS